MSRRLKRFDAPQWLRWSALVLLGLAALWGQGWLGSYGTRSSPSELLQDGDQRIQELFDARSGLDEAKQAKRRTVGGS